MLVLEKTRPTKLIVTGEPEEVEQLEHMLDFLGTAELELKEEEWVDGETVQQEILDYLQVPLGALLLKHYREVQKLSCTTLAEALGISPQQIHNLEIGKASITPERARQFETFFHIPAQTFLKQ